MEPTLHISQYLGTVKIQWIYFPPEMRNMKYCRLEVLRMKYFMLVMSVNNAPCKTVLNLKRELILKLLVFTRFNLLMQKESEAPISNIYDFGRPTQSCLYYYPSSEKGSEPYKL